MKSTTDLVLVLEVGGSGLALKDGWGDVREEGMGAGR